MYPRRMNFRHFGWSYYFNYVLKLLLMLMDCNCSTFKVTAITLYVIRMTDGQCHQYKNKLISSMKQKIKIVQIRLKKIVEGTDKEMTLFVSSFCSLFFWFKKLSVANNQFLLYFY